MSTHNAKWNPEWEERIYPVDGKIHFDASLGLRGDEPLCLLIEDHFYENAVNGWIDWQSVREQFESMVN